MMNRINGAGYRSNRSACHPCGTESPQNHGHRLASPAPHASSRRSVGQNGCGCNGNSPYNGQSGCGCNSNSPCNGQNGCGCNSNSPCNGQNGSCKRLLEQLRAVDFALWETVLYLDVYPHSCDALETYHKLKAQSEALRREYETLCGPMSAGGNQSTASWDWVSKPFPWEYDAD